MKEGSELGNQFLEGINSIGAIFLSVAGIITSTLFIAKFVSTVFGQMFEIVWIDTEMKATTFIAVDIRG